MLRDPSLIPLSHQHQHALALCVLIDRDATSGNVEVQAQTIVDHFESEMRKHFEIEEQLFFPAVLAFASVRDLILELVDEHRRMEALVHVLRSGGNRSLIMEFTGLLRQHIRKEESVLFAEAQRLLPREKLDHLGQQIAGNL